MLKSIRELVPLVLLVAKVTALIDALTALAQV